MMIVAKRDDLLKTLRTNRAAHAVVVDEARKGYLTSAAEALKAKSEQIRDGKVVALRFTLEVPRDHTSVYDTAIKMLELHLSETVELGAEQVRHLVMFGDQMLLATPTLAISLRQPWAWMVVHGPKRIENRRWHLWRSLPPGQTVFVHAAKYMTIDEYYDARAFAADRGLAIPDRDDTALQFGGIIGKARVVGCLCPGMKPADFPATTRHALQQAPDSLAGNEATRWWMREQHGFVLQDVAPVPFTPLRGLQGFFAVPPDVLAALYEAA